MAITFDDIQAAADRLKPYITHTPLLHSAFLDQKSKGQVYLKAECLQLTGSFKIRGALNRLLQLSPEEKRAGVVAYSSGNHAQGVALAARLTGVKASIIMPADAPAVKTQRTQQYGAKVIPYDRYTESREEIAMALSEKTGAVLVPPFDDPFIMTGQGTVGLEIALEAKRLSLAVDQVLVNCSGGGLTAGVSIAVHALFPQAQILTVEPDGFDDMKRSLKAKERLTNDPRATSICDALLIARPGEMTFPVLQEHHVGGVSVPDGQVRSAIRYAAEELKVVVEPGGAAALAAILYDHVETKDRCTIGVLTGGNIDHEVFTAALKA